MGDWLNGEKRKLYDRRNVVPTSNERREMTMTLWFRARGLVLPSENPGRGGIYLIVTLTRLIRAMVSTKLITVM